MEFEVSFKAIAGSLFLFLKSYGQEKNVKIVWMSNTLKNYENKIINSQLNLTLHMPQDPEHLYYKPDSQFKLYIKFSSITLQKKITLYNMKILEA